MDLDHRAAEAAALLRDEVDGDIDLDAAYGRVLAGAGRRRARTAGVRLGVAALVALVAVGALAVVQGGGGTGADGDPGDDGFDRIDGEVAVEAGDGLTERGAAILGGLPEGPLDGKQSYRLPVVADPATGLSEGDQVMLYGRGWEPGETVGAVHCAAEADVASAGVDACDLGDGFSNTTTGTARADGTVVITVTIRRHITTPGLGPIDCASGPERCLLAIGAAADYDRSGGTYVQLAEAPPFPVATSTIDPAGPYTAGQEVTVAGASLVPNRHYQVEQCVGDDHCASLTSGRATPEGTYAAVVVVGGAVDVDGDVRPCGDACTLRIRGFGGLPEQTSAEPPPPMPLGPITGDQVVATPSTAPPAPVDPGQAEAPESTVVEGTAPEPPTTELPPGTEPPTTVTAPPTTTTAPR